MRSKGLGLGLPQELLLEVLAFAPMRSYGRLAMCARDLERLIREHAPWHDFYAAFRGGGAVIDDDDDGKEGGVVERGPASAATRGRARSEARSGIRTRRARPAPAGARSRPSR